jgi:phosphoglycolate phosphatase
MFAVTLANHLDSFKLNNNRSAEKSKRRTVSTPMNLDSKERVAEFLNKFDFILSDCDGVLWVNNDVIPGAPQAINKLRAKGKRVCFATNNSTKTRTEFQSKLTKLGYESNLDELFPTSYSTAIYLKSIGFDRKVFIVGSSGIAGELENVGISSTGVGPDHTPNHWTPGMANINLDPEIGAVVVGFDNQISFPKLTKACSYARKPDCLLIASNADETYPHPDPAIMVPGPGAYLAAIQAVTGKEVIPLGKPYKYFFDIIRLQHPEIDPKRTIMIGDRLTTDMVFGRNNGLKTLFVQSGIGTYDDMINFRNSDQPEDHLCVPDYYLNSLDDLNKYF